MKILRYVFRIIALLVLIISISFKKYMSYGMLNITFILLLISTIGFVFFEIFFFIKERFNRKW